MFGWFKAGPVEVFGKELATFFIERQKSLAGLDAKRHPEKMREILSKMSLQLDKFTQEHSPGILQKAKLANSFRWALQDAAVDQPRVDELVSWLTRRMG